MVGRVGLARGGVVSLDSVEEDEVTLRVLVSARRRSFEVTLWPDDLEWQCDCPDGNDRCGHVAAGVIAYRESLRSGRKLTLDPATVGRLGYRLRSQAGELTVVRVLKQQDEEFPCLRD